MVGTSKLNHWHPHRMSSAIDDAKHKLQPISRASNVPKSTLQHDTDWWEKVAEQTMHPDSQRPDVAPTAEQWITITWLIN